MNSVQTGQVWSVLSYREAIRYEIRIVSFVVDEANYRRAICARVPSGKPATIRVRALERGDRGARLVKNADGTQAYKPPPEKWYQRYETTKTASDYRRTVAPKGLSADEREQWKRAQREGRTWP